MLHHLAHKRSNFAWTTGPRYLSIHEQKCVLPLQVFLFITSIWSLSHISVRKAGLTIESSEISLGEVPFLRFLKSYRVA